MMMAMMMPPAARMSDEADKGKAGVDPQLWHACAGGMVHMPKENSRVYYYPQGHAEHAATPPDFHTGLRKRISPALLCRVLSVRFLADGDTDEVYARMTLLPIPDEDTDDSQDDNDDDDDENRHGFPGQSGGVPTSFAKTLTQSDANNGGGFSVPRYCAETIFPRLDYSSDPPVQTVVARDVHGEIWKFRHIYRGTPRRHLLTTGWSTFVNHKKLVAGDAIVFLRSASGELCVGVRRSARSAGPCAGGGGASVSISDISSSSSSSSPTSSWHLPYRCGSRWEVKTAGDGISGFARNRGRVSAKSVLEAASLAASGQPFEVVYYPRASNPEFCVKAKAVKAALRVHWSPGMRFKMAFETEDSSRISWFMGTVSSVHFADPVLWLNSPWRLLQVTWDEPDILQNVKRVSPWLVELVSTMPPIQMTPFSLPKKKLRLAYSPGELQPQLESSPCPPVMGFHAGMGMGMGIGMGMPMGMGLVRHRTPPWQAVSENVPAGMQGARQDRDVYGSPFSDFYANNISGPSSATATATANASGLFFSHCQAKSTITSRVSTELNIGTSFQLESAGSASDVQSGISCLLSGGSSSETETKGGGTENPSSGTKSVAFLLFGKPIHAQQECPKSISVPDNSDENTPSQSPDSGSLVHRQENVLERMQQVSGESKKAAPRFSENAMPWVLHDSLATSNANGVQWAKRQAPAENDESSIEDSIVHCKVFKETEEVGRTVDLSLFCTYEQLYDRLAKMFGVTESELSNRVLYNGFGGSLRHAGDEPYKDFMKTVRRLTILSESGCDNMAR